MLEQTKSDLENNMNGPVFAYTDRATQFIAGCSSNIITYLMMYSVVKYSIEFVAFTHVSSSSGFSPNANAHNDAKQPVTRNLHAAVCDVGRRNGRRTSHTNGVFPLIRGTLQYLGSKKLIHESTLATQYGP